MESGGLTHPSTNYGECWFSFIANGASGRVAAAANKN
jgi:hypothetical protein